MRRTILILWVWATIGSAIATYVDVYSWNAGRCGIGNDGVAFVIVGWPALIPGAFVAFALGARPSNDTMRRYAERSCT